MSDPTQNPVASRLIRVSVATLRVGYLEFHMSKDETVSYNRR
jgi:hypothetical protein